MRNGDKNVDNKALKKMLSFSPYEIIDIKLEFGIILSLSIKVYFF